jgi:hypothetical protein
MESSPKNESVKDSKKPPVLPPLLSTALVKFPKDISELPLVNVQLSTINLFLNWANNFRSQYLIREVSGMKDKIRTGQKKLGQLEDDVSVLNGEMKDQSANMYEALAKMKKELEEQKRLLQVREAQIEKFTLSQFQRDAALDSVIFGISYLIISTPLIQWPIEATLLILYYIPGLSKVLMRKRHANGLVQLLLIYYLFSTSRQYATEQSWHNQVGTPKTYALYIMRKFKSVFESTRKGLF